MHDIREGEKKKHNKKDNQLACKVHDFKQYRLILKPLMSSNLKKAAKRSTAARIEPVTQLFEGGRDSIELSSSCFSTACRADWKQLTCINETEARAVSCDVIMVTSHFESFGSILGHFPTFATSSALYQWSCLGLPYRAVECILYRSVTPCIVMTV